MNDILMIILKILIIFLTLIVLRYIAPYLSNLLRSQIDSDIWETIVKAVKSVQQDPRFSLGSAKKLEVIRRITNWANRYGIDITSEQLSELIEAAVWTMKHEDDLLGGG